MPSIFINGVVSSELTSLVAVGEPLAFLPSRERSHGRRNHAAALRRGGYPVPPSLAGERRRLLGQGDCSPAPHSHYSPTS